MRLAMLMVGVGLAACAGGSSGTRTTHVGTADDPDMICRQEARTGSNITQKVCRPRAQSEHDRKDAEDFMRASRLEPRRR